MGRANEIIPLVCEVCGEKFGGRSTKSKLCYDCKEVNKQKSLAKKRKKTMKQDKTKKATKQVEKWVEAGLISSQENADNAVKRLSNDEVNPFN